MDQRLDWERMPEVAEVRRWRLLAAGRKVIQREGLDRLTVADVTREAHVAKGTFYTYFPSREAFLDALRAALGADVIAAVRAAAAGPWEGIFARMMIAVAAWLHEDPRLSELFGPAYLSRAERPTRGPMLGIVTQVVRDGIAAGVFQPLAAAGADDPAELTALAIYDVLSAGVNRVSPTFPDTVPIEASSELVQRALRFDAAAAKGGGWPPPRAD